MKYLLVLIALFCLSSTASYSEEASYEDMVKLLKENIKIPESIEFDNVQSDIYIKIIMEEDYHIEILKGNPKLTPIILQQLNKPKILDSISTLRTHIIINFQIRDWRKGVKTDFTESQDSFYVSKNEILDFIKKELLFTVKINLGNRLADIYEETNKSSVDNHYSIWENEKNKQNLEEMNIFEIKRLKDIKSIIHMEERGLKSRDYDLIINKDSSLIFRKIEYKECDTIFQTRKIRNDYQWLISYFEEIQAYFELYKCFPSPPEHSLEPKGGVKFRIVVNENGEGRDYSFISPCSIAETNGISYYERICFDITEFKNLFKFAE